MALNGFSTYEIDYLQGLIHALEICCLMALNPEYRQLIPEFNGYFRRPVNR